MKVIGYLAVEVNKRTGCHQLLNIKSLPRDSAVMLFHTMLPRYDETRTHLHRELMAVNFDWKEQP